MKIYRIADNTDSGNNRLLGYKIMLWDKETQKASSICDTRNKIDLQIGKVYSMAGDGIYLGNTREYVLKYFYVEKDNESDPDSILLTFEFDSNDIIKGNFSTEYESEGSVRRCKLIEIEVLE